MRIRIQHFDADPDFYLVRMRIRMWIRMRTKLTKMMRILLEPDPDSLHWKISFGHAQIL
jgi:hypothetical protein